MINSFTKQIKNCSNCRYNIIRIKPYPEIAKDIYCIKKNRGIAFGYHTLVSCKQHKFKKIEKKLIERNHDKLILDVLDGLFLIICNIFDWIEHRIDKK